METVLQLPRPRCWTRKRRIPSSVARKTQALVVRAMTTVRGPRFQKMIQRGPIGPCRSPAVAKHDRTGVAPSQCCVRDPRDAPKLPLFMIWWSPRRLYFQYKLEIDTDTENVVGSV